MDKRSWQLGGTATRLLTIACGDSEFRESTPIEQEAVLEMMRDIHTNYNAAVRNARREADYDADLKAGG